MIAPVSCILLFALMLLVSFLMENKMQDDGLTEYALFWIGAAGFLASFIWLCKVIMVALLTVHG